MTEIIDEQLIEQYLKGNEKSLEILIKRYLKPIYSFVYKKIGDSETAEDITQEVFVKAWKNLKKPALSLSKGFDPKQGNFKTWLFSIAKNASIDYLRKKKISIVLNEDLLFEKSDFVEVIEQKYSLKKIHEIFQELSPNYRAIILLKNENNFTFREIAKELGEPLNTVKSRYRRAVCALKDLVS